MPNIMLDRERHNLTLVCIKDLQFDLGILLKCTSVENNLIIYSFHLSFIYLLSRKCVGVTIFSNIWTIDVPRGASNGFFQIFSFYSPFSRMFYWTFFGFLRGKAPFLRSRPGYRAVVIVQVRINDRSTGWAVNLTFIFRQVGVKGVFN